MKKKLVIQTLTIAAILLLPAILQAQPGFTDDVVDAPVDGGLSLLIAAGVSYGAKRIKEARKKTNKNNV